MAGRHRVPPKHNLSDLPDYAGRAAVSAVAASVLAPTSAAFASSAPNTAWNAIIQCESGNRNVHNSSTSASGFFQIIDGTWRANGGLQYGSSAIEASRAEQQAVADRIYERAGHTFRDWNASRGCWGSRLGLTSTVPQPAVEPVRPADAASAAAAPAAASSGSTYRVVLGDTLIRIGTKTGINWRLIAEANNLSAPFLIYPGNVLNLPPSHPTNIQGASAYTVMPGYTLVRIAARHATTWRAIYALNVRVIGPDPAFILPGQVLSVPGDGTVRIQPPPPPPTPASSISASPEAQIALRVALAQVGKPYQWAAAGPNSFDCSGLIVYAYAAAGVTLPHSSKLLAGSGTPVRSVSELQPGDLVIWPGHSGIYVGGGRMVAATTPGSTVKVQPLSWFDAPSALRRIG